MQAVWNRAMNSLRLALACALCSTLASSASAQTLAAEFSRTFGGGSKVQAQAEQFRQGNVVMFSDREGGEPTISQASFGPIGTSSCCDDGCTLGCDTGCCEVGCAPTCDVGCNPCIDCCVPCCLDPWIHRDRVWATYLFLHATDADMHHAYQQNGTGGAGTTPFGDVAVCDPDFESGVQMGGALALNDCSSFVVAYTYLDSDSVSTLDAPAIADPAIVSLVHHPGADVTHSTGPLYADYTIKFQTADAAYSRLFMASCNGWANYSIGARYARLDQDFYQQGTFAGSQGGVINTATEVDFEGAGLRFAVDGERKIGCRGFSVYGNAAVSPLFGSAKGDFVETNATSVTDLAIVHWEDDRVVPMLEYEVGVAWTSCKGHWRLSAGYMATHWFNTVTTPEFVDAYQANNYTNVGDTLSFSGLTSKIEWLY